VWELLVICFVLLQHWSVPFALAFAGDRFSGERWSAVNIARLVFDVLLDCLLAADMVVRARSAFFDANSDLVWERSKTFARYRRTRNPTDAALWADALAMVPGALELAHVAVFRTPLTGEEHIRIPAVNSFSNL